MTQKCSPNCPCWGMTTSRPRACPFGDDTFKGNGWDGIDAHYKARHERQTDESYESWWSRMCDEHRGGGPAA